MKRSISFGLFFIIIWQGFPPEASGTLMDQDYFTASESPGNEQLLRSVDTYHTNKAERSMRDGKYGHAVDDLKYTLDRFPNHPRALMLMSLAARLTKDFSLVLPYYRKALKLYPQHALTHAQFGSYLVDVGRSDLGIAQLEVALEIDPKLAQAHAWLAIAYFRSGRSELARAAVERARELGFTGRIDGEASGKLPE